MRTLRGPVVLVFLFVLFLAVLTRNLFLSSSLMPFEGWDEYQHLAVVAHYAEHGAMPILDKDSVPVSISAFLLRHPHPSASARQLAGLGARNYKGEVWQQGAWVPVGAQAEQLHQSLQMPRLYQAQHGPLYYQVTLIIKRIFEIDSPESLSDAARVFNSVCGAVTAVVWFFILALALRNTRFSYLPYLVLMVLAANSIFAFNSARVANDAFANLLASIAVFGYLRFGELIMTKPLSRSLIMAICLGILCGLAVLAKATAIAVLPVIMMGFFISGIRRRGYFVRTMLICCVVLGAYTMTAGKYHVESMQHYGGITAMQEAVDNRNNGKGLLDLIQIIPSMPLNYYYVSLNQLHTGGWSFGRPRTVFNYLWKGSLGLMFGFLVATIIVSLPEKVTRRPFFILFRQKHLLLPARNDLSDVWFKLWELMLLCVVMWSALLYHSFHCMLARGYVATNPWYATLIFPIILVVLLFGVAAWQRKLAVLVSIFLFVVYCMAFYTGTYVDLFAIMTNESDYAKAIALTNRHHGFLRLPASTLFLEFVLYFLLALLAMFACRKRMGETNCRDAL